MERSTQEKNTIGEPLQTNLGYDECSYEAKIKESMLPGLYNLSGRFLGQEPCLMKYPGYNFTQVQGIKASHIDAESELRRLNYPLSKCPSVKYNPLENCKNCKKCNAGILCKCDHCVKDPHNYSKEDCKEELITQYTREPKSCNILAGININRFEPLICPDNFKVVQPNSIIGANTRDMAKYRKTTKNGNLLDRRCVCAKKNGTHLLLECAYEE